ncbi:MAG: alpha/beta hydrolase [Chitinophagaceae bacterium]
MLHYFRKGIAILTFALTACQSNQDQSPQKLSTQPVTDSISVKKPAPAEQPIWSAVVPDSSLVTGMETYNDGMVRNVSKPTITVYAPDSNNTGAAVLVFPGGGYNKLAIDLEGREICQWLASIGVTGVLLKYRVPASGPHRDAACGCEKDPVKPIALQDAQRAVALVRSNAAAWKIDPAKIGVMGFSAGGHLVADVSTNYRRRAYVPLDPIDQISCRPDFGIVFFPGHMSFHASGPYALNRTLPVDKQTPPMFILQAGNDPVDTIQHSLRYYIALKKANVPTEYHIYAEGGHAFGLHKTAMDIPDFNELPISDWPVLVERWLRTIGMTTDRKR